MRLGKKPHEVPHDCPEAKRLCLLATSEEEKLVDNLEYFARWLRDNTLASESVHEEAVDKALDEYFSRSGSNGYLKRKKHPLRSFAEDAGEIVLRLISLERLRTAPSKQTPSQSLQYVPQQVAQNGRALLGEVFGKRPSASVAS